MRRPDEKSWVLEGIVQLGLLESVGSGTRVVLTGA